MKVTKILILLLIIWVLGFCSLWAELNQDILPLGPSRYKFSIARLEKDQVMQTSAQKTVAAVDIVTGNKDADVFIIGEAHTSYECHTFQRDLIEALYKENPKIVVGFEFFLRDDDDVLEQWRLGKISEEELLNKTGWYKKTAYNYGYTRLVMDVIRKHKIKVIGLNVSRDILRKVSRQGFKTLSKKEKALFPTIGINNAEHEYFIKSIFGTFAVQVPMWFENIYSAQKCWDVVMAESMRQALARPGFKGWQGVIIAGSNHVAYKLGIPFRYLKADKNVKLVTIVPVLLPEEKQDSDEEAEEAHPMMKMMGKNLPPAAVFSRGIADYVFSVPKPEPEFFPVIGIKLESKDNRIVITKVDKESSAEKGGLREGDIIHTIDGIEITSVEQVRMLLATKNWDDSVVIKLEKRIDIKKDDTKDKES